MKRIKCKTSKFSCNYKNKQLKVRFSVLKFFLPGLKPVYAGTQKPLVAPMLPGPYIMAPKLGRNSKLGRN